MPGIVYGVLDRSEIQLIRPLWDQLRLLTREMTTHFKEYYEKLDFDERTEKFFRDGMRVCVEVARDGEGGEVVGYAIGSVDAEQNGEIDSFYVDERYRRRGIGARLLERILAWMTEQEPVQCAILTAYENREVLPLYEKLGFYPKLVMLNRK
jgi:GNAT superfamily N-acetyltransferase